MTEHILTRIDAAGQQLDDAVAEVQAAAEEFSDFAARMRTMTDRLQRGLKPNTIDTPGPIKFPRMLQGGPEKREAEAS